MRVNEFVCKERISVCAYCDRAYCVRLKIHKQQGSTNALAAVFHTLTVLNSLPIVCLLRSVCIDITQGSSVTRAVHMVGHVPV